jgi:hypothetical protein
MRLFIILTTLAFAGCSSVPFLRAKTPEELAFAREKAAAEAASDRFDDCMRSTLASVGPFTYGGRDSRLRAAEICKDVMIARPANDEAKPPKQESEKSTSTP